ncbi:hypothetical protein AAFC00_001956 [Neodothiora populina]|uniref:Uncharacterized protein n=1 Tax=Neodothiora populina TaxID=2781224 RepID=A0ABR3PQQ1_9PEZI
MPSATPVRAFMRTFTYRNAATAMAHKHDNAQLARKLGRTAAVYFPFYAVVLGWPFLISSYGKRYGF